MIIERVKVTRFRGFENFEFNPGKHVTVITGKNGTQKTTLMGLITQPFAITNKDHPLYGESPLCGGNYKSAFAEKFKFSPKFDLAGTHQWELDIKGYDRNPFPIESIFRQKSKNDDIRIYKEKARKKGDGYFPIPVIYLSLKRLFPIGEDKSVKESEIVLLDSEEALIFNRWHEKLLNVHYRLSKPTIIKGSAKESAGVEAEHYDWYLNSAGQDNISKILLAILSFRRLKELHSKDYLGGILAIDELDATLHASTLIKLFRLLCKSASDYNIQIFLTTHSLTLIKEIFEKRKDNKSDTLKLIYLEKLNEKIEVIHDITYDSIVNRIQEEITVKNIIIRKPVIFTEDNMTRLFTKLIIGSLARKVNFIKADFSYTQLIELSLKKVHCFKNGESLIILDGDVRNVKKAMDKIEKWNLKNILLLPDTKAPELIFANYLSSVDDKHPVWKSIYIDYSRDISFKNYKIEKINLDSELAKTWYNEQVKISNNFTTIIGKYWIKDNQVEVEKFKSEFQKQFLKLQEKI